MEEVITPVEYDIAGDSGLTEEDLDFSNLFMDDNDYALGRDQLT